MKQVLIRQGSVVVENVPSPLVEAGSVLVQTDHSCISPGTELAGIQLSGKPLWKRVLEKPEQLKKVWRSTLANGIVNTVASVQQRLSEGKPMGYSLSGTVLKVGKGVDDFQVGDRVACAGNQFAFHAQVVCVPRNLVVHVPPSVDQASASTVSLGSIALQGVRRASPTLGESFVVLGLGLLGQLTVQILRANGCRVIGLDPDDSRIELAKRNGMDMNVSSKEDSPVEDVMQLTDGYGADGVIITAATPSNDVVSTAFKICRKKGRVVLVGDVGLDLNRSDMYLKELDFFISTSYGPGRYDDHYEQKGFDYPLPYVRWTENRNMSEYLKMISEKKIDLTGLMGPVFSIDQATEAYALLGSEKRPLMALFKYPSSLPDSSTIVHSSHLASRSTSGAVGIAVVGAGGFAKSVHLPNLKALSNLYNIQAVVSRAGHNAQEVARQFGAAYATTDFEKVLADPKVEAVLIATRHNLHASLTLQALRAGKHVLVEKPLALTRPELEAIQAIYVDGTAKKPLLMTGYNRRFSSVARDIKEKIHNRTTPFICDYRLASPPLLADHWVHSNEGGGQNLGEACHIYDLFTFFAGSAVESVQTQSVAAKTNLHTASSNFSATIKFMDGSVATLTYTDMASKDYPKEQMELFCGGQVYSLNDFRGDKGHRAELEAFAKAISKGGEWPISLAEQVQSADIALTVEESFGGKTAS